MSGNSDEVTKSDDPAAHAPSSSVVLVMSRLPEEDGAEVSRAVVGAGDGSVVVSSSPSSQPHSTLKVVAVGLVEPSGKVPVNKECTESGGG